MKISLPILATVVLSALKVSGVIAWSWLWVLFPLWVPLVISIIIAIAVFVKVKGDSEKLSEITEALKKISKEDK